MAGRMPAAPATHDPDVRVVSLDSGDLDQVVVRVRRNPRSRHVRLHVSEQGEVTATVPPRLSMRALDEIVRERAGWLDEALLKMRLASRSTEVDLRRGDPVRFLGTWRPSRVIEGGRNSCRVDDDGTVVITVAHAGDPYDVLVRWYRAEARRLITDRIAHFAELYSIRCGRVSIRDQRTRWGSCSQRGDLSFSWRLVLAPPWVLDSIVVHELCHIDELNHSDRFWSLLDARFPRHREARGWLEQHGAALRVNAPKPASEDVSGSGPQQQQAVPARVRRTRRRIPDERHLKLF